MTNDTGSGFEAGFGESFSRLVRARRTAKVLARNGLSIQYPHADAQRMNQIVLRSVADAGFAPFHYHRKTDGIAEPWRFYVLWRSDCRFLSDRLADWFTDIKPDNKLSAMLAACGCLVLINWIPQFTAVAKDEKQRQIDEEHLAATAAATQTFLLSLTANGLGTYWSSGGFFRMPQMFERLGIPPTERLLSAIFIDYGANPENDVEVLGGKLRDSRCEYQKWTRELSVEDND